MKRIISIVFTLLVLCGCTTPKVTDGEVIIDLTQEFDVNTILENVKEDTEVSYELDKENSKIIISLTRNDETETLEKEVTILEPQYTIKDDIKFNPYLDYNINDFITVDEGVKIDHTVDTKTSKITFNLSKGIWSKTVEKEFTIDSLFDFSNVGEYGALIYKNYEWVNKNPEFSDNFFNRVPKVGYEDVIVFAPDHTGFHVRYIGEGSRASVSTFIWTEDGKINYDYEVYTPIFAGYPKIKCLVNYFGGEDNLHETFVLQNDGTIKLIADEKRGEVLYYERVDSYNEPYSTAAYLERIGLSIEKSWTDGSELIKVYYEFEYKNYSIEYPKIKNFAEYECAYRKNHYPK